MLIVGLNGSPRPGGNTARLLAAALEAAAAMGMGTETLYIQGLLEDLEHPYCIVCSKKCEGKCYRGTSLEKAYRLISQADGLLLGSPVHFGTMSAQMKVFWDMSRALRGEKKLINTVGGCITCGTARFGGQETTIKAMMDVMLVHGMIVVADGLAEFDAGHHGVCAQDPAGNDVNALKRADILGRRMAEVARATASLRK